MIGFMNDIYEDELCYSWLARYVAHSGYPTNYGAMKELIQGQPSFEFMSVFHEDAKRIIANIISMEELALKHTMFPIFRFSEPSKFASAWESIAEREKYTFKTLPLARGKGSQCIRYCPICASEQRKMYGEAYCTRKAQLRNINVCAKHKCRLKSTDIKISDTHTVSFFVLETLIQDLTPEFVDAGKELKFAEYVTNVFSAPVDMHNEILICDYLKHKLEGTKYMFVCGSRKHIDMLINDITEFYKDIDDANTIEKDHYKRVFNNRRWDFYTVCQIAFFLGIDAKELETLVIPEKSQADIFCEKVMMLYNMGMKSRKIASELNSSSTKCFQIYKKN